MLQCHVDALSFFVKDIYGLEIIYGSRAIKSEYFTFNIT